MKRIFILLFLFIECTTYGKDIKVYTLDVKSCDFRLTAMENGSLMILSDRRDIIYKTEDSIPALPYIMVNVLVAPNEIYSNCSLQSSDSLIGQNLCLAQAPKPDTTNIQSTTNNRENLFEYRESVYPSRNIEFTGTHISDGYRILSFLVCPFRYDVGNKNLYFKSLLKLEVKTVIDNYRQPVKNIGQNMRRIIRDITINGEEIDELYTDSNQTRSTNNIENYPYRYLIVTSESMKPAFEELVKWKTMKGVRTKILTTDSIYAIYTNAVTPQEKIKEALADYYNGSHSGLEFVLLGGDTNIIPAQMCFVQCGNKTSTTPTDLYYACLDDICWDKNGNGIYGELIDSVDISPEIFVTRIPVRNLSDARAFVNRVISYERNPTEGFWHDNFLMGGCMLDTCYTISGVYMSDTQYKSEKTYQLYIEPEWGGTRVRFYDTATDFPDTSYVFNAANLQEQLASGYNFVDIETHGNDTRWKTMGGYYRQTDAASLENNGYSIVFTTACNTNAFDRNDPCLSEAFMRNHQGGILAYIGCSREGWYFKDPSIQNPSNQMNEDIYEILFGETESCLGEIVSRAKGYYNPNYYVYNPYRWLLFGVNPLGDPEMPVFISSPNTFDNVDVTIANGEIRVRSNVPGCRFCVMDKTNPSIYYIQENSNVVGVQNLDGVYQICITKPGYMPYIAIAGSEPYVQDETIDYPVHVFSSDKTFIGSNVTNQQSTGPVMIKNRGNMIVKNNRGVFIERDFSVEVGSSLEIE